mmetsp:Transcript_38945/g.76134  ORF Transcript_38945/g.76134 Transcript_38945/m.76134 type:complete len:328 (-) Transcript_38945:54-1037(-)
MGFGVDPNGVWGLGKHVGQRFLDHQSDAKEGRDDDGARPHPLEQRLGALLSYDAVHRRQPPLVGHHPRRGLRLQTRLDHVKRGGAARTHHPGGGGGAEGAERGDHAPVVGELSAKHAVEGKVDDGEGHVAHEGRHGALIHAAHAHLLDHVAEHLHLVDRLPRSRLVHLHSDLGDLHRRGHNDLARPRKAPRRPLPKNVPLGVHRLVVDPELLAEKVVPRKLNRLLRHDADDVGRKSAVQRPNALRACHLAEAVEQPGVLPRRVHLELRLGHVEGVHHRGACDASKGREEDVLREGELGGGPDGRLGRSSLAAGRRVHCVWGASLRTL